MCYKVVILNTVIKDTPVRKKYFQSVFLCCRVTCGFVTDVAILDELLWRNPSVLLCRTTFYLHVFACLGYYLYCISVCVLSTTN